MGRQDDIVGSGGQAQGYDSTDMKHGQAVENDIRFINGPHLCKGPGTVYLGAVGLGGQLRSSDGPARMKQGGQRISADFPFKRQPVLQILPDGPYEIQQAVVIARSAAQYQYCFDGFRFFNHHLRF